MSQSKLQNQGASPSATGLAGAEAPEPHSRLGPADGIPSAGGNIIDRLRDEADLCRNEGADDIADLLDETWRFIDNLYCAAANLRQAQRDYMEVRNGNHDTREAFGRAVADAADKLDDVLASGMSAFGQDAQRLEAQPASPTAAGGDAQQEGPTP